MNEMSKDVTVAVVWDQGPIAGEIDITNGRLGGIKAAGRELSGEQAQHVQIDAGGLARLEIRLSEARTDAGAFPTIIQLRFDKSPIAFFLRDVNRDRPIYVPQYGVAITSGDDPRSYAEIARWVAGQDFVSHRQRFRDEPEESYEHALPQTRSMCCPTWLAVARDIRLFRVMHDELAGCWGRVVSGYPISPGKFDMTDGDTYILNFLIGPGASCRTHLTRWLEEGVLPILRSTQEEGDVSYEVTAFATLETQPVSAEVIRGSDWRGAYDKTYGNMYSAEDRARLKDVIAAETTGREEETVCCVRVEAVNRGRVPRYAWFKAPRMTPAKAFEYDAQQGFAHNEPDRVYAVCRMNGQPMPQDEMAVLIQPGGRAVLEMLLPHQPLSQARAGKLAKLDVDAHLSACRAYWCGRLTAGAHISVPERTIDERIRAGLLHLDIAAPGLEPDGSVMACVGGYPPIGTESSPIIQFLDSMGWHDLARRAIQFFLDRQRDDGFIQNFGGYESETAPVLWTAGEHFRYTRDEQWVARIKPKLLKSCQYIIGLRRQNQREELRGTCYGLISGKVADPEHRLHSFLLNGQAYLGLQRASEMLANVDPAQSAALAEEAAGFRQDILVAFEASLARSPVVPLGDGTWAPAPAPWTESPGATCLYPQGGHWCYGTFSCNDSLLGPTYLVLGEILNPAHVGVDFMLRVNQELMTHENAALMQPYYCRHDFAHIKRGEVKEFLKTYYNQLAALADRETYTFWECYNHASQHKTHEEGWFLMQTRWMLWLEEGDRLTFLRAVPRRWLEDGKEIRLHDVATYFGRASLTLKSMLLQQRRIVAEMECSTDRGLTGVTIRVPHPDGLLPIRVEGGAFDPVSETVTVASFRGRATISLYY